MTYRERQAFARQHGKNLLDAVLAKLPLVPESWEESEIKELFADVAEWHRMVGRTWPAKDLRNLYLARRRRYRADKKRDGRL